ncbi:hypothetical protein [[Mycoplasma] testudinis]|uniref:hypothetical protein n=1 Tax=[Mycoplasma] testudinis TaxID=33924 RepID=UPI000487D2E7|nr:hypothetical protein [[Mycoplasma] testudinis]
MNQNNPYAVHNNPYARSTSENLYGQSSLKNNSTSRKGAKSKNGSKIASKNELKQFKETAVAYIVLWSISTLFFIVVFFTLIVPTIRSYAIAAALPFEFNVVGGTNIRYSSITPLYSLYGALGFCCLITLFVIGAKANKLSSSFENGKFFPMYCWLGLLTLGVSTLVAAIKINDILKKVFKPIDSSGANSNFSGLESNQIVQSFKKFKITTLLYMVVCPLLFVSLLIMIITLPVVFGNYNAPSNRNFTYQDSDGNIVSFSSILKSVVDDFVGGVIATPLLVYIFAWWAFLLQLKLVDELKKHQEQFDNSKKLILLLNLGTISLGITALLVAIKVWKTTPNLDYQPEVQNLTEQSV